MLNGASSNFRRSPESEMIRIGANGNYYQEKKMSGDCDICGEHTLECACKPYCRGQENGWIKVKDGFPKDTNDVLVIDDNNRMAVSCYFYSAHLENYLWESRDDQIGLGEITHWMPLPESPND